MISRMEEQQQRRAAESRARQQHHLHKAPSTAAASHDAAGAQPVIIECRKKNSKQETVITHRFRKGRLLGKGGFAHCYKVTCLDTARPFAMKIVPKSTLVKSRARQKLQTEIKIHRTLQHPRVVRFEMFFEDRENVYILLELCTNHSLSELIRKTKRFTEDEARRYMLQILEATSYLHRHQIIHRDLKLGNVFLDRDWNIKMGDFGLATKLAQDGERKRTICGTPNYIAPEILEGKAGHSYQVDLWSAGVILYTMLVGRPPYESNDVKSTYKRILANVYAFPESVAVSDSAKNLVGRLLQVKPELRPSLDEVLNHPFLRNGGPRQRFSTSHGLRGSSASSSPSASTVPGGGDGCVGNAVACPTTGSLIAARKRSGSADGGGGATATPERGAGGGFGRPPLKTRSSNVDGEGEVPTESGVRSAKPRAGTVSASAGKASGTGGSKNAASRPSSTRSAVPRTNSTKGFSVYCDAKDAPFGAGSSGSRARGGIVGSGGGGGCGVSKWGSPATGGSRRRSTGAGAKGGGGHSGCGDALKSPDDKENDPRHALGGGGVRVAVHGPVSRRPVMRSVSSVGVSGREASRGGRAGTETVGTSSGPGGPSPTAAGDRKATIRRSASAVGTAEYRRMSARDAGGISKGRMDAKPATAVRRATSAAARGSAGAVTPRVRCSSSKGASGSPATTTTYSPYRSPLSGPSPAGTGNGGGSAARVSARIVAVGDGVTPCSQAANRSGARQRLDFGSTPRATRRRDSPAKAASSGGGVGGGISGKGASRPARPVHARGAVSRGASCPPPPEEATKENCPGSAGVGERSEAAEDSAADKGGSAFGTPRSVDLESDALCNMHEVLAAGFAVADAGQGSAGGATGRTGAARGTRASAAAAAAAVAAREAAAAVAAAARFEDAGAPTAGVWVTQYVDYSSKYGLGFLLSDGSAGVYFNDATKIVLEPAGETFEYIERARRSWPAGGGVGGGGGGGGCCVDPGDHPPRVRHTLQNFPPELQKKVTLLNHFRGYLHELVKKSEANSATGGAVGAAGGEENAAAPATAGARGGRAVAGELTFLRKWMRTRNAILFRLSNRTVQVVFSDCTEILLSNEARVVTYVGKNGERETTSLRKVLQDQRPDVTKRLRYSNELIAQLLRRA